MAWKFGMKFLGVTFWSRDFWGFVWSPRDFLGFWFLPPFDHPCLLKSREAPLGHTIVKHWQGHGLFLKTWNKIQNSDKEHTYHPSHKRACVTPEGWKLKLFGSGKFAHTGESGAFNWFALNFFTKFLYVKLQASYKMKMKVTNDNQFNTMITGYSFCSSVEGKQYLKKTIWLLKKNIFYP